MAERAKGEVNGVFFLLDNGKWRLRLEKLTNERLRLGNGRMVVRFARANGTVREKERKEGRLDKQRLWGKGCGMFRSEYDRVPCHIID
ncbi:hypothetical protein LguiB_028267 [Lonicera macranthoides]